MSMSREEGEKRMEEDGSVVVSPQWWQQRGKGEEGQKAKRVVGE